MRTILVPMFQWPKLPQEHLCTASSCRSMWCFGATGSPCNGQVRLTFALPVPRDLCAGPRIDPTDVLHVGPSCCRSSLDAPKNPRSWDFLTSIWGALSQTSWGAAYPIFHGSNRKMVGSTICMGVSVLKKAEERFARDIPQYSFTHTLAQWMTGDSAAQSSHHCSGIRCCRSMKVDGSEWNDQKITCRVQATWNEAKMKTKTFLIHVYRWRGTKSAQASPCKFNYGKGLLVPAINQIF